MACEELSLNWNDHHETLVAVLEKLLERNTLVDCVIAAEGQYVKAHKIILSACSSYFELLFSIENGKNPIIVLKDIKFRELKAMIEFMYRGSVKIPIDHLQDFVDAAESLQIKGLSMDQRKSKSGKAVNEFKNVGRKKDEFSPRLKKRFKSSSLNKNAEESSNFPSEMRTVHKNITNASHSHRKLERGIAKPSSLLPDTLSDTSAFINIGQENHENTKENIPCATDQSCVLVVTEAVVKTEPEGEPVAVSGNLVEPKTEKCVQEEITLFDSDDEAEESLEADEIYEENSQELSSFSQTQELVMDHSYALEELEHSNTQGSLRSRADENQLASSSWQSRVKTSTTSIIELTSLEDVYSEDNSPKTDALSDFGPSSTQHVRSRSTPLCQICGLEQRSLSHLIRHMRSHTGERPFRCPQCERCFSRPEGLRLHQLSHTGARPYKCGVCEKSFSRPAQLRKHKVTHTVDSHSVRRYSCGVCEKSFSRPDNLKQHEITHTGVRPYKCELCEKSFFRSDYLQEHVRIHTGDRPYKCEVCEKTFTQSSNLRVHKKTHEKSCAMGVIFYQKNE